MVINITPELFIETLAELLEKERDRRMVRLLSQNRAKAQAFMERHSPDAIGPVDRFKHPSPGADALRDRAFPFSYGKTILPE